MSRGNWSWGVCVCTWERERERERVSVCVWKCVCEIESVRVYMYIVCVCVYVCVCVCVSEWVCVCPWVFVWLCYSHIQHWPMAKFFRSRGCYVIYDNHSNKIHLWKGCKITPTLRKVSHTAARLLKRRYRFFFRGVEGRACTYSIISVQYLFMCRHE